MRQRQELPGTCPTKSLIRDPPNNPKIVLANASIVNINPSSSPDLYYALRGGGNNFGIVTRFDLETFPQGNMWGGMRLYPVTANASLLNAFVDFTNAAPSDPDAALLLAFVYYHGGIYVGGNLEHAHPVKNPAIFDDFMKIESLSDTLRITTLTDLTLELNASNPGGLRQTYVTATFKPNVALFNTILELFTTEVEGLRDAPGILPELVFQPITTEMISHFGRNGGNALGIEEGVGPLVRKYHPLPHTFLSPIPNINPPLTPPPTSNTPLNIVVLPHRRRPHRRSSQSHHRRFHTCCKVVEFGTQIHLSELRCCEPGCVWGVWSGESAKVTGD